MDADTAAIKQLLRRIDDAMPPTGELSELDEYLLAVWIELWPDTGMN
jgi:hypothetical protein